LKQKEETPRRRGEDEARKEATARSNTTAQETSIRSLLLTVTTGGIDVIRDPVGG
jgi:hypothetical protein